eukprot:scpid64661/ scgid7389/ 
MTCVHVLPGTCSTQEYGVVCIAGDHLPYHYYQYCRRSSYGMALISALAGSIQSVLCPSFGVLARNLVSLCVCGLLVIYFMFQLIAVFPVVFGCVHTPCGFAALLAPVLRYVRV